MWHDLKAMGWEHLDGGHAHPLINDEVLAAATYAGYVKSPTGQIYQVIAIPADGIYPDKTG